MKIKRVGFRMRVFALILDGILLGILEWVAITLFAIIGLGAGGMAGSSFGKNEGEAEAVAGGIVGAVIGMFGFAIIGLALFLIAYLALEAFTGFTVGKWLLGIRVATVDGQLADIKTYFQRFLLKNIAIALFLLAILLIFTGIPQLVVLVIYLAWGLGSIIALGYFLAIGPKKQALHDLLIKTAVYRSKEINTKQAIL